MKEPGEIMKSPQEKAEELVEKFKFETKKSEIINDILLGDISVILKHYKAKQCALISQKILLDKLKLLNIKDEYEENVLLEIIAL